MILETPTQKTMFSSVNLQFEELNNEDRYHNGYLQIVVSLNTYMAWLVFSVVYFWTIRSQVFWVFEVGAKIFSPKATKLKILFAAERKKLF